jgi:serine-type D-Ala-D-Ala carboxypeptidase/endopeptidase (penicillin-binding protein 4)
MSAMPVNVGRTYLRPSLFLVILILAAVVAAALQTAPPFASRIDRVLEGTHARTAIWGIYVQDVESGRVLYQHNADKTFLPASNQKLLTTATALDALGSDFRYTTTLHFNGTVSGSVMRGDIILEGSGDPTLGSSGFDGGDALRQWARELGAMGIERIEGRLIGDGSVFDNQPYAAGWDVDYFTRQPTRILGFVAGGLAYHDNIVRLEVRATREGAAPEIRARPAAYMTIDNQARTSARSRGNAIQAHRRLGTDEIRLNGTVPANFTGAINVPVADPVMFTLHAFDAHLRAEGIQTELEKRDARTLPGRPPYDGSQPLFVYRSPTLAEIIQPINKRSDNFYAEQLFRTVGWGGSADGAQRRIKSLLSKAGASTGGLSIMDGSGLSRKNMITPEALGRLLVYMHKHPEREAFISSLARGGENQTTLRHRLAGTDLQAKTGSLDYVRTLAGYTRTADGRTAAFVVFANNYTAPAWHMADAVDQVVVAIGR